MEDELKGGRELFKGCRDNRTGGTEGVVLVVSRLHVAVGQGAGVAKQHFGREHLGARANAPGQERLGDLAGLDGLGNAELFGATDLAEENNHFALGIVLEAVDVVDKGRAGVPVATNRNSLSKKK